MKALLLRFLPSLIGGWQMYALAALGVAVVLLGLRMHWIHEGREQILKENAAAAIKIVVKQGEATEKIVKQYVKVRGATEVVTQTVEKEVIKYAAANLSLCLDSGWRLLHDRAAINAVSEAPKRPDDRLRTPAKPAAVPTDRSASPDDGYIKLRSSPSLRGQT